MMQARPLNVPATPQYRQSFVLSLSAANADKKAKGNAKTEARIAVAAKTIGIMMKSDQRIAIETRFQTKNKVGKLKYSVKHPLAVPTAPR